MSKSRAGASPRCGRIRALPKDPSLERGGWCAEKRKPVVSAILADRGGRLSARQQAQRSDSACSFAAFSLRHRAPL